jgi:catechol 2,3-dioxygenase-like lactoylglutathione lyase family enzyme
MVDKWTRNLGPGRVILVKEGCGLPEAVGEVSEIVVAVGEQSVLTATGRRIGSPEEFLETGERVDSFEVTPEVRSALDRYGNGSEIRGCISAAQAALDEHRVDAERDLKPPAYAAYIALRAGAKVGAVWRAVLVALHDEKAEVLLSELGRAVGPTWTHHITLGVRSGVMDLAREFFTKVLGWHEPQVEDIWGEGPFFAPDSDKGYLVKLVYPRGEGSTHSIAENRLALGVLDAEQTAEAARRWASWAGTSYEVVRVGEARWQVALPFIFDFSFVLLSQPWRK